MGRKKNLNVDNTSQHAPEQIEWKEDHNNYYLVKGNGREVTLNFLLWFTIFITISNL